MLITPEQVRAARALLRLEQAKVARDAGISIITLRRLEGDDGLSKVAPTTVGVVRRTLERAGAEFIENGVRRRPQTADERNAVRADVDRIVARGRGLLAKHPPLADDELYDEHGL